MKHAIFISLIAYCVGLTGALAGGGNNVSSLNAAWGGSSMKVCGANDIENTEACIGESQKTNCKNWSMYARNYTDEYAIQMMVAHKVTEFGAKFCPTQVEGRNKNKGNAWTEYADLTNGNDSQCVWLCKKGHTGPECDLNASEATSCDISKLERKNYSSIVRKATGTNIEDTIAMFRFNVYDGCGAHKGQEHDIILAITRYLPSGHGAYVRQMVVRAERSGWKHMISTATVYPADNSSEILVCKNGYTVNAAGTDCEELNPTLCRMQQMCTGWSSGFDETLHRFIQLDGETCFQYRCMDAGQAFASDTNRSSCVDCVSNMRSGISPINGVCIECEVGKIFDANARSSGFCVTAQSFTKTDLQYGKGKSKNTASLKEQCWPLVTTSEYKACVFGEAQNVSSPLSNTIVNGLPVFNKNLTDNSLLKNNITLKVVN